MSGKLLPISEYQQRFFLEWALAPEDNTYNIALVYKIKGNLDKSKLIQACDIFSKKHEILHVRYSEDGGKCYYENYDIKDFFHEVELDPNKDINLQLRSLLDKHFNLTYDVLLQFILIKNSGIANEYYFIGPMAHHIIADAYSASVCVKELSESYNLLINKHSVSTNVDKTFTEAVKSVQQTLTFEYKQKAREYWLNFITDFPLNINLPYKSGVNPQYLNNKFTNKKGEFIYFDLNEQETQYLKKYARQNRSTLFYFTVGYLWFSHL